MELIGQLAPKLHVGDWINSTKPLELRELQGRVVVLHAFQMLCPGCILHGVPQAQKIHEVFPKDEVVVIGLHTVFEHHNVMGKSALEAFVHEFRLSIPIGIDLATPNQAIPQTMAAYQMRGTPTLIIIDRDGIVRWKHFGRPDDMVVGSQIARLVEENSKRPAEEKNDTDTAEIRNGRVNCGDKGCSTKANV